MRKYLTVALLALGLAWYTGSARGGAAPAGSGSSHGNHNNVGGSHNNASGSHNHSSGNHNQAHAGHPSSHHRSSTMCTDWIGDIRKSIGIVKRCITTTPNSIRPTKNSTPIGGGSRRTWLPAIRRT